MMDRSLWLDRLTQADAPVDVHAHHIPEAFLSELRSRADRSSEYSTLLARILRSTTATSTSGGGDFGGLDARAQIVQDAGIWSQILSHGSLLAIENPRLRRETCRLWNQTANDEILASTQPHVFRTFAAVPYPDAPTALNEAEDAWNLESTVGFTISSHVFGQPLMLEQWRPVLEFWNSISAVVFVHPNRFRCQGVLPATAEVDLGTQFDDAMAAWEIATSPIVTELSNIRWIVAHLGGGIWFHQERLHEHWERDRKGSGDSTPPGEVLSRLWYDTAGHGVDAVQFALKAGGISNFVLGTDFPVLGKAHLKRHIRAVESAVDSIVDGRRVLFAPTIATVFGSRPTPTPLG